ncbi:uncharacterized protein [Dermacentor andersoni]|uniref:uncharacterized protein n=1 Tax=Dermacentor andersoni TaxID=34620 RepID=UPI002155AE10|nr:uncharacterized protein LOC126527347 [Dermacentor andersoni]
MRSLVCVAQALLLGLVWIHGSHAACQLTVPKGFLQTPYPDVRKMFQYGYKLTAEANNVTEKNTYHATEYYDAQNKEGYLNVYSGNQPIEVYYSHRSNEAFFYTDSHCETYSLDNLPSDIQKVALKWSDSQGTFTIVGVSTLFMAPLVKKGVKTAFQGTNFTVRSVPALKWSVCLSDDDTPIDVYFSDPKHSTYGNIFPLPLRIVQGKEVSDIMMMQDYVVDVEDKFKIPAGRGCARIKTPLPKPPSFANVSIEFHSELMFRNFQSSSEFYYSSHLDIIRDISSDHMSAVVEPWATSERNAQKTEPAGTYQEIYDYYNGILYKIDKSGPQERCTVTAANQYTLNVTLPGLGDLDMLNVIFVDAETLMNASYLGVHTVRNMPTHAFELLMDGLDGRMSKITQATITYYYLKDNMIWDRDLSHRNIPVKITARTFTASQLQLKPFYEITLNIHDLTTVMERMNEKMNVLSCYNEDDQSYTWLQVGFPAKPYEVQAAVMGSSAVKEKFLQKLYEVAELTPPRVPRVLADFTSNMVFMTALILERPAVIEDYVKKDNFGFKTSDYTEAVLPLQNCLKICSSSGKDCTAVAYCGASCYTTSMYSEDDTHNLEKSVDCNVYAKTKLGMARKLPVTLDAVQKVVQAVADNKFVIFVRYRASVLGVLTLAAETTDDSLGSLSQTFGASDRETRERHKRFGPDVPGFVTAAKGVRISASAASSTPAGRFPLEDCADICRDRDDCQAFSSCLVDNECVLSTDRTPPGAATEKQTMCAIFSKTYTNSFNEFEGMSLDMKARKFVDVPADEDCARLCLSEAEFECKSFDYCTMTRDPATVCRLHDTHLREYGDPAKLDAKNAEKCFHYSKKYLYDFKKMKNQRITDRQQFTAISQVSAEECARQCWEATFDCKDFDFCFASGKQNMGVGTCTMYAHSDEPVKTTMSPVCSTYAYTGNPDLIRPSDYALSSSLHSNATAGGLSFLLILLGIGLGAAGLFAYGFYRSHRANRV